MKQLILASQSPRRSEILKKAGYQFVPFPVHVSEIPDKNLNQNEQILDIARRKAEAVCLEIRDKGLDFGEAVVLTADTMVCLGAEVLGKPDSPDQARSFLLSLSAKKHQVKTAICLIELSTFEKTTHIETTDVFFRKLSEDDIANYILTGEPLDKAGAYAIQGEGRKFVEKFEGDFNNVVGLPLHALENIFKMKSWDFLKTQPDL
jgi:septum formation protein